MKKISEIVKDPKWQKVRQELLGNWKDNPEENCKKIRSYLGSMSSASEDQLRIVMNYLISSGFRLGKIKNPCISKIRVEITVERNKRKFKNKK